jgi:hypothetical protein
MRKPQKKKTVKADRGRKPNKGRIKCSREDNKNEGEVEKSWEEINGKRRRIKGRKRGHIIRQEETNEVKVGKYFIATFIFDSSMSAFVIILEQFRQALNFSCNSKD